MRGWAGSVYQIAVFPTGISVSGQEILPYEHHFSPVTDMKAEYLWRPGWHRLALPAVLFASEASHLTAVIPALRVTKAMIGTKVIIFVFCHVCFVSRILCQNSSPESLAFFQLGNRTEISHMNPGEIGPSNWAIAVNWAHVKKPKL